MHVSSTEQYVSLTKFFFSVTEMSEISIRLIMISPPQRVEQTERLFYYNNPKKIEREVQKMGGHDHELSDLLLRVSLFFS